MKAKIFIGSWKSACCICRQNKFFLGGKVHLFNHMSQSLSDSVSLTGLKVKKQSSENGSPRYWIAWPKTNGVLRNHRCVGEKGLFLEMLTHLKREWKRVKTMKAEIFIVFFWKSACNQFGWVDGGRIHHFTHMSRCLIRLNKEVFEQSRGQSVQGDR